MEDDFDARVVAAVFQQAGLRGWNDVSLVEAARDNGLDLGRVRTRFPTRNAVLMRFGLMADQAALARAGAEEAPRERLFDMLLERFEVLQRHRPGVLALMRALRTDPGLSLLLGLATLRSMGWLLEAAGVPATGFMGALRTNGLLALWLYALRAWEADESEDLSATMAAVDRGLDRAMQAERGMPGRSRAPEEPQATPAPPEPEAPGGVDNLG